jgi:hypothetical protein
MALALEEMGFIRYSKSQNIKSLFKTPQTPSVDVRTMKPPADRRDYKPAKYIMITGDTRLSPNNDADLKALTNDDNINGEKIKVVLISQAGSEGLDFKAIRQIHILEPWYNINRIEQILGRGIRNFSHKDLPFEKRNVQIFLYGTILENAEEESADLYVYRLSEIKAVKIGKVTRLLKQISVDCVINHDQTQFTIENFNSIEENTNIVQILSDHKEITNFKIGDVPNSATCDYMECEYQCLPESGIDIESNINYDTYNQSFMLLNSDKIIQKIRALMRMKYFYKKNQLFQLINTPKKYPTVQIYAALTQMINDNTEYITDAYSRTGHLVNIGDYYLFQPSELNNPNISVYDRSVPIDFKHNAISFEIKDNIIKPFERQINEYNLEDIVDINLKGKKIVNEMFENYKLALKTTSILRGNYNWYEHCGVIIRKMNKEDNIEIEMLESFLIEHIVDMLMMHDKIEVLNYLNKNPELSIDGKLKRFVINIKKYLHSKIIVANNITGIIIFDGPSRIDNLHIFILKDDKWVPSQAEDKRDLQHAILQRYKIKQNLNEYVGFIGFENNKKYMVYKIKDTKNERSTGFRCDQSGKEKIINVLNIIEGDERFENKRTKDNALDLCIRQEFTLRNNERNKLNNKTWFLDTEMAIINEFEKKEKMK